MVVITITGTDKNEMRQVADAIDRVIDENVKVILKRAYAERKPRSLSNNDVDNESESLG